MSLQKQQHSSVFPASTFSPPPPCGFSHTTPTSSAYTTPASSVHATPTSSPAHTHHTHYPGTSPQHSEDKSQHKSQTNRHSYSHLLTKPSVGVCLPGDTQGLPRHSNGSGRPGNSHHHGHSNGLVTMATSASSHHPGSVDTSRVPPPLQIAVNLQDRTHHIERTLL